MIGEVESKKIAFAFVDEGSFGEMGLEVMKDSCKKKAKICFLDSVGADAPLQYMGNDIRQDKLNQLSISHHPSKSTINYIISAETSKTEQGTQFFLTKAVLNQKKLNLENVAKLIDLYK